MPKLYEDSHTSLIRYHLDSGSSWNRLRDDRSVYGSSSMQECFVSRPSRCQWVLLSSAAIIPGIIRQMPATVKERKRSADRVVSLLRQQPPGRLFRRRCHPRWQICQLDRLGQLSLSFPPKLSDSYGICWKCIRWTAPSSVDRKISARSQNLGASPWNCQRIIHARLAPMIIPPATRSFRIVRILLHRFAPNYLTQQ